MGGQIWMVRAGRGDVPLTEMMAGLREEEGVASQLFPVVKEARKNVGIYCRRRMNFQSFRSEE